MATCPTNKRTLLPKHASKGKWKLARQGSKRPPLSSQDMTTTPVRASGNLPDKQVATCPTNKWQLAQQTSGNLPNKQVATCPTSRWQLAQQASGNLPDKQPHPPNKDGWTRLLSIDTVVHIIYTRRTSP
ncbi:MAG: hypothetical protein CL920_18680 [Deltaproteobacteria bacterium]|nr:hypothetical protein [Deltaproteobacteria bacterium]